MAKSIFFWKIMSYKYTENNSAAGRGHFELLDSPLLAKLHQIAEYFILKWWHFLIIEFFLTLGSLVTIYPTQEGVG